MSAPSNWTDVWVWIRIRFSTLAAARAALRILGLQLHDEARVEPDKTRSSHLRAEGDHYVEHERELQDAEMKATVTPPAPAAADNHVVIAKPPADA